MFFVAKDKIGTTLGAQKEFAACERRGIRFQSAAMPNKPGHHVWHYFWPADMIEPSIRARFTSQPPQQRDEDNLGDDFHSDSGEPTHYLWSQEVAHGEVIGDPVINPHSGASDWVAEAKAKFDAAQQLALSHNGG